MILAIIPTHIINLNEQSIPAVFLELIEKSNLGKVIILDASQLPKKQSQTKKKLKFPVKWVDSLDLFRAGKPEFIKIHAMVQNTPENSVLVLNASLLNIEAVFGMLDILRLIWFQFPKWPKALFIICEDSKAVNLARHMANSFLMPTVYLDNAEVKELISKINHRAKILQIAGNGRLVNFVFSVYKFCKAVGISVRNTIR